MHTLRLDDRPVSTAATFVYRLVPWLISALAIAVIWPTYLAGWQGDDMYYSLLNGTLEADHVSLGSTMQHAFQLWFFGNGRFYPGSILEKYVVFHIFTNLVAYKTFLVIMTLLALEAFRRCVAVYSTIAVANFAALLACALFQERRYHDSIIAYNAMPQSICISLAVSMIAYRRSLLGFGKGYLLVALVLYLFSAVTYEDVYLLAVLFVPLSLSLGRRWRTSCKDALPFVAIAVIFVVVAIVSRASSPLDATSTYAANAKAQSVARTAAYQITAGFPLMYYIADPSGIFGRSNIVEFTRNAPISPWLFVAFAFVGFFTVLGVRGETLEPRRLLFIGALVAVLPAVPIAFLNKYQAELRPGLGYLPVFLQVFGVAMLEAAAAFAIKPGHRKMVYVMTVATLIAVIGSMTAAANLRLGRELAASGVARESLVASVRTGMLAGVPDGTAISFQPEQAWVAYDGEGPDGISSRGLFYMSGHRRVRLVPPEKERCGNLVLKYDAASTSWTTQPVRTVGAAPENEQRAVRCRNR